MAEVKKFALIPEELVAKHTVSNKRLSELDKLMIKILNSDLPDHEKVIRYREVLQKSLNLQEFNPYKIEKKEPSEPAESETKTSSIKRDDEKDIEEVERKNYYQELILGSISKPLRRKAESVLAHIKGHPSILSWDEKGEVSLHGEKIKNSNIVDWFNYMYNSRKVIPHRHSFEKAMTDLNIPKSLMTNKRLVNTPEELEESKKIPGSKKTKTVVSKYKPVIRSKSKIVNWDNL